MVENPKRCLLEFARRNAFILAAISALTSASAAEPEQAGSAADADTEILQLVQRARIPLAVLSPDGRHAAYLIIRGDALHNRYDVMIFVVNVRAGSAPRELASYTLPPDEAFTRLGWPRNTAGGLRWLTDDLLLISRHGERGAELLTWSATSGQSRSLLSGYDRIDIGGPAASTSAIRISTTRFLPGEQASSEVRDRSWRVRDDNSFTGPLEFGVDQPALLTQEWELSAQGPLTVRAIGSPVRSPFVTPPARTQTLPDSNDPDSITYRLPALPSRNGARRALIEYSRRGLRTPAASYSTHRIVLSEQGHDTVLVPDSRPSMFGYTDLLGWAADQRSIFYVIVDARRSTLNRVTVDGRRQQIVSTPALLQKPCRRASDCQFISDDSRVALMVRSSNHQPAELASVDLRSGEIQVLARPNADFDAMAHSRAIFYDVGGTNAESWGRLYLPSNSGNGPFPLVITQYNSSPGFAADIGDEVPISALNAAGIAVFDMYSLALNASTDYASGNPAYEINRVARPLAGMQWIVRRLAEEGIVDPSRVGITGLSYGAEIAMYAYWNWPGLAAVSSSYSWATSSPLFVGPSRARALTDRGLPSWEDAAGWRAFDAGLHANRNLPPLLMQTTDGESNLATPTWTRLRLSQARVERYEYAGEFHVKINPATKWWVYHRNLDWFRFWLLGYEDPDPSKADQYARWRAMRENAAQ